MTVTEFLDLIEARGYRLSGSAPDPHEHVQYRGHGVELTVFMDSVHVQTWTRYGCGGFPMSMPAAAVAAQLALLESVALPELVAA